MDIYSKNSHVLELEQIYSVAPLGLCVLDANLCFVRLNQKLADINGYPLLEHIGKTPFDVRPDIAAQIEAKCAQVFATGEPARIEYQAAAPARPGEVRYWLEHYYPLKSRQGAVDAVSIIVQDITDQKGAEETQRARRMQPSASALVTPSSDIKDEIVQWRRTQKRLEHGELRSAEAEFLSDIGSFESDPGGQNFHWSESLFRIFHMSGRKRAPTSEEFRTLVHPDDLQPMCDTLKSAFATGDPYVVEYRVTLDDGSLRYLNERGVVMHDERAGDKKIIGTIQDVTALKQTEAALQSTKEMFHGTFKAGVGGVAVLSLTGNYLEVNDALCEMLGYSEHELLKKNLADVTHPDDLAEDMQLESEMGPAHIQNALVEKRFIHKTGEVVWTLAGSAYTRDAKGGIQNIISHTVDISERKRMEQVLRKNERRLRKLTSRLVSVREVERTMIAREIHDELGQALTCLKLDLSWLGKRLPMNAVLETATHINRMNTLINRMIVQVRDLSSRLRPSVLDDLGIEAAIEWEAREFARRSGCECFVHLDDGGLPADTNRDTEIFRIFQEALTNIARHSKANRARVDLKRNADKLLLKISDNGKGISAEALESTQSLGLIGMHERVRALDGELSIQRLGDEGTEVSIVIPIRNVE